MFMSAFFSCLLVDYNTIHVLRICTGKYKVRLISLEFAWSVLIELVSVFFSLRVGKKV